jgi:Domain of unknown function (DUF5658)
MAGTQTQRSTPDERSTDAPDRDQLVLDLRGLEPLVDLRGAPTIRLSGPPLLEAPLEAAAPPEIERRDATQRARYIAVVVIAVLNIFDIITTYVAISMGAHEGNPLVAWMISSKFIIFAKILTCGGLIFGALLASQRRRRVTLPGLCIAWAVVGVYSLVVVLNTLNVFSRIGK